MDTNSKVSLINCSSYDPSKIEPAIHECLRLLGGINSFVKPGQTVLIKPNALLGKSPESAVTTHPSIVAAVVKEVVRAGAKALVGDSPGNAYSNVVETMEKTGIKTATEAAGGEIVSFQQEGIDKVKNPSGNKLMEYLHIARPVLEADVIINLPKLKTHNLTGFTGAIKNMFGSVPGFNKASYHASAPQPLDFSKLLVDVYQAVKPELNIMDAVVGMEGPGPSNGRPRKMGLIAASADGVALDAVCSYLIGYQPYQIDTTAISYRRGLGEMNLEKIEIAGADLEKAKQTDWRKALNLYSLARKNIPEMIYKLILPLIGQIKIYPEIDQEKCTRCLVCVENCPTKTINHYTAENKVVIDQKNCISCFCCHELCAFRAVKLRRSWLVRLFKLGEA